MEYSYKDELYHHGILGQKWGKRNGPPYPLGASDHSASEKKAGWRKSLDNKSKNSNTTAEKRKQLIKTGAIIAGGILAAGTAVYLVKSGKFDEIAQNGRNFIENQFGGHLSKQMPGIGKAINDIDRQMVKKINAGDKRSIGRKTNCAHTSLAYVLNSVLGENVKALPYNGIDEFSGMVNNLGRHYRIFEAVFDGIGIQECASGETMFDTFKSLPDGSTGILQIRAGAGAHYLNYEKTATGDVTVVDCQTNKITSVLPYVTSGRYSPIRVMDCSNVTLKPDADKILQYMVKGI